MNVVVLNDSGSINGGAAQVAIGSACALAAGGHHVHLVCGAGPIAKELENQANLTVHCLGKFDIVEDPNRFAAMARGWWNPATHDYVGNLLDSLSRTDTVIHLHNWARALSSSVVAAALDRKFQVIVTLHDFQLACPTGNLFLHQTQERCALRPMSVACISTNCDVRSYSTKLWRVGRQAIQQSLGQLPRGVEHFIHCSHLARRLLQDYLPADAQFHLVPNAIEMPFAPPANVRDGEDFMFLGRLVNEKGPVLFARAAAAENVKCRLIGRGPAQAEILEANPEATLSGWMNRDDAMRALRGGRALVFPSLWYETLGLVVLEAAGNGVPSIVPDSCAASESVEDGVTGLHFRSGDEADLRAKIRLLKDPETAARMGEAAHKRFWADHGQGIQLHIERLEAVYRQVLAEMQ